MQKIDVAAIEPVRPEVDDRLLDTLDEVGAGCIAFSPLAQGLLTDRYLHGVPSDCR
jgi:L-glyceraldehyde 3-phosphate reductase